MIKTGRVGNIVLGVGDPSKFNLLGGSFGKAGDVLISGTGSRAQIIVGKGKILVGAGSYESGGRRGGTPSGPNPRGNGPWTPDRYRRPY